MVNGSTTLCGSMEYLHFASSAASPSLQRYVQSGARVSRGRALTGDSLISRSDCKLRGGVVEEAVVGHGIAPRPLCSRQNLSGGISIMQRFPRTKLGLERVRSGRDDSRVVSDEAKSGKADATPGSSSSNDGGAQNRKGFVEKVEAELGRQFGGVLWFFVLFTALAIFGGGYAYFIINFADYSDIPILRGPQQ